ILGAEVERDLFGSKDARGSAIRIGQAWCTVIGIMEAKSIREGRATVIKVRNINRDIYVPITTALRRYALTGEPSGIDEIAVRVRRTDELSSAAQRIKGLLRTQHNAVEDYEIIVPEELLAQSQRTQRIFNVVMGSIAGLSLLVGGIGIMNIMLANISERTRE